jgi:prepilin-type N-terminal cleavage/methylation domain-containing protein
MKKGYTLIELLVVTTIALIFGVLVFAGIFLVKGCNAVTEKGLKHTVEDREEMIQPFKN